MFGVGQLDLLHVFNFCVSLVIAVSVKSAGLNCCGRHFEEFSLSADIATTNTPPLLSSNQNSTPIVTFVYPTCPKMNCITVIVIIIITFTMIDVVMISFQQLCCFSLLLSDPRGHHRVVAGGSVHWSTRSAWHFTEVHRTSDHHAHCGLDWPVWLPGCRRASWETLGYCHAVSTTLR